MWRPSGLILLLAAVLLSVVGLAEGAPSAINDGRTDLLWERYIVVLKKEHGPEMVDHIVSRIPAEKVANTRKFMKLFVGFSTTIMDDQAVQMIQDYNEVHFVEKDSSVFASYVGSWGLDRVDQRDLPLDGSFRPSGDGTGVNVYVFDTGIRFDHVDFGGRARTFFNIFEKPARNGDCNGHGTHCAGIIGGRKYGVAKNVTLWAVRVLSCEGSGLTSDVLEGLEHVALHGEKPAVISMSLGGPQSVSMNLAITSMVHHDFTVVVAAGNDDKDACNISPAGAQEAITVGSIGHGDIRSSFSNYGPCVNIFAPGEHIRSDYCTSPVATAILTGTSMAAPHVTGVAALKLQENPSLSPWQVKSTLICTATPDCVVNAESKANLLVYDSLHYDNVSLSLNQDIYCSL